MNSYKITGLLNSRDVAGQPGGPLHIGAGGGSSIFTDRLTLRDVQGRVFVPGTSLRGVMASLARVIRRLQGGAAASVESDPAFFALFGTSRGASEGQASRLTVRDCPPLELNGYPYYVRDRNGVNRSRGSADNKRLFHDEVADGNWSFQVHLEFHESGPKSEVEQVLMSRGQDPNGLAWNLLLSTLDLMEQGWLNIGANSAVGYGRAQLQSCQIHTRNRSDPNEVIQFALTRWQDFAGQPLSSRLPVTAPAMGQGTGNERLRITYRLRPLEPLLVKAGYTTEVCYSPTDKPHPDFELDFPLEQIPMTVDAGFCLDVNERAYVPGSSIRGVLRTHVERIVRSVAGADRAWDLSQAQSMGQTLGRCQDFTESDVNCLVSRVFGFSSLGGRLRFSDLRPIDPDGFESRRKFLDHVALDRFTGGAADQAKFNSRPYFPPGPGEELDNDEQGDLEGEIEMFDYEPRHLGMLLMLLRDLRLGRVCLGHGKYKGFGRVRLQWAAVEAINAPGQRVELVFGPDGRSNTDDSDWNAAWTQAIDEFRHELRAAAEEAAAGGGVQ